MEFSFFFGRGGSGACLGRQIAQRLGGKMNPQSGYENDICIFVKKVRDECLPIPKHSYIQIGDGPRAYEWVKNHPEIGVICDGVTLYNFLTKNLKRDDIVLIPHHHCNFERFIRTRKEVKTVGIIGAKIAFQHPIDDIRKRLKDIGLDLIYEENYWGYYKESREKVVEFFKNIDIQIAWRPNAWSPKYIPFRRPLKLANAGSFGIPTVAYPEQDYVDEWNGCFISANNIDYLVGSCKELKNNKSYYEHFSQKALYKSYDYHIDEIVKLYRELK
jgi:hypothetical protein